MVMPIKGVYIKSNPGDVGDALIKNITYENISMQNPLWWGIYIGPQQQKQPGGYGPGCFTYPLQPCATNPLVSFEDITLRNVTSTGGLFPAGIVRCNSTNPCKNFKFDDVHVTSPVWDMFGVGYITEYIQGTEDDDTPIPDFNNQQTVRNSPLKFVKELVKFLSFQGDYV